MTHINSYHGEKLIRPREMRDTLRISQATLYRLVHKGELKHIKVGGSIRFLQRDLEEFLQKDRVN